MTTPLERLLSARHAPLADLPGFCHDLFASFARSDQRRWGEVYVSGLLSLPGRKTIRRISDHVVGWRADQCLQQFVNQSPWRWAPVRRQLAVRLSARLRPRAWVISDVVFPKNGTRSVGVAKQYCGQSGRMLNCQLGVSVMLAGDAGAAPVNWRLRLPAAWDDDQLRRGSRLPEDERPRARWQYILDALDEMVDDWRLPLCPVVLDARDEAAVDPLLRGLEGRGMPYLVRISPGTPVQPRTAADGPVRTAATVLSDPHATGRMSVRWRESAPTGAVRTHMLVAQPIVTPGGPAFGRVTPHRRARRVVAEWCLDASGPAATYLTNLTNVRMPGLVSLIRAQHKATEDADRLIDFGLRDFEGRSFTGWHHHVTMVSIAHGYRLAQETRESQRSEAMLSDTSA